MKGIVGYLLGPMRYARPRGNVKFLDGMFVRSDHIGTNEAAWVVDKEGRWRRIRQTHNSGWFKVYISKLF